MKALKKPSANIRMTITITPQIQQYLFALVELGLYGATPAEIAVQLICEQLRDDLKKRRLALLEQE